MNGDVKILGRITRDDPEEMFIRFRPKSPAPAAAVALARRQIVVIREPGDWVTVELDPEYAEEKGLGEFI